MKANASENSDLFWALKGGGSNFGMFTLFYAFKHYSSRKLMTK